VIWEAIPRKKAAVAAVRLDLPGKPRQRGRGKAREDPLFPNASVTVAHGQLLVASVSPGRAIPKRSPGQRRSLEKRTPMATTRFRSRSTQNKQNDKRLFGSQDSALHLVYRQDWVHNKRIGFISGRI
jgi:hypothetical protein